MNNELTHKWNYYKTNKKQLQNSCNYCNNPGTFDAIFFTDSSFQEKGNLRKKEIYIFQNHTKSYQNRF